MTKPAKVHMHKDSDVRDKTICGLLTEQSMRGNWFNVSDGGDFLGPISITTDPREVTCSRCARGIRT
jgi:hypothetical protein